MAASAVAATSCHVLLFLRSQPPSPSPYSPFISLLKLKPLFLPSSSNATLSIRRLHHPLFRKTLISSIFSTSTSSSRAFPLAAVVGGSAPKFTEDEAVEEYEEGEERGNELETEKSGYEADLTLSSPLERNREERLKLKLELELPSLTVKERKELASFAHSLGKKLKTQLVGKSGVTPNLVTSFSDTLEANELLKIKVHRSCPGELDDVVKQLEETTSSVTVGQIGRTLILYRPSLSKLKAEEKKKQVRKLFLDKQRRRLKLVNMRKEQAPNSAKRGSSWKARGRESRP